MAERYLELHSEFRQRHLLFYLVDGQVRDSRVINWRRVEWERVVKIEMRIRNHVHVVTCCHPLFQFFVHYKATEHHSTPTRSWRDDYWLIGWCDGRLCHMKEVAFKTGDLRREFVQPVEQIASHIHPRVQGLRAAAHVAGMKQPEID